MKVFRENNGVSDGDFREWETLLFTGWLFHLAIINRAAGPSEAKKLGLALSQAIGQHIHTVIVRQSPDISDDRRRQTFMSVYGQLEARALAYNEAFERDKIQILKAEREGTQPMPGVQLMYKFLQNCIPHQQVVDSIQDYDILWYQVLPEMTEISNALA